MFIDMITQDSWGVNLYKITTLAIATCFLTACAAGVSSKAENEAFRNSDSYVQSFDVVSVGELARNTNKDTFKVGDIADVSVYNVEALSNTYVVDGSGNISFPLIGVVQVAGLTTSSLQKTLTLRYGSEYLREPGINVKLESKDLGRIVVDGAVRTPGVFEVKDVIRLTEAIALAEGLDSETTTGSQVYIARTINGERKVTEVDLRSVRKFAAIDPQIIPNDVIFVQDSRGRVVFRDFLKTVPLLNTATLLAIRR